MQRLSGDLKDPIDSKPSLHVSDRLDHYWHKLLECCWPEAKLHVTSASSTLEQL
jgi:hypothetical protein